jgi:hypothetical protein
MKKFIQNYRITFEDKEHREEFEDFLTNCDISNWKRIKKETSHAN